MSSLQAFLLVRPAVTFEERDMMKHSVPIIFLLLTNSPAILSLDPLSWGMVAGAGVFTSFLYSSYDQIKVRFVKIVQGKLGI